MIDDIDLSDSTLRLLASEGIKAWSTESVINLLFDNDYIVRTLAARELHNRGGEDIYERIIKFVDDRRDFVREISAFVLGQLGAPDYPFRDKSLSYLKGMMNDSLYEVRAAVIAAIGHLSYDGMPAEIEDKLIRLSDDSNSEVRSCVAYALGNSSGNKKVAETIDKLLKDEDPVVRSYAQLGQELLNSAAE